MDYCRCLLIDWVSLLLIELLPINLLECFKFCYVVPNNVFIMFIINELFIRYLDGRLNYQFLFLVGYC